MSKKVDIIIITAFVALAWGLQYLTKTPAHEWAAWFALGLAVSAKGGK